MAGFDGNHPPRSRAVRFPVSGTRRRCAEGERRNLMFRGSCRLYLATTSAQPE
jgi:hypothetical protein